eukprot:5255445-Pyramimonas_sp.AAC.1
MLDMAVLNTYRGLGATYCNNKGQGSQLGYIIVPGCSLFQTLSAGPLRRIGGSLQAIAAPTPRDHIPVHARISYALTDTIGLPMSVFDHP